MNMITQVDILAWIDVLQSVYAAQRDLLTDLDAAIGDADHGINMDRGFTAVKSELAKASPSELDALLKQIAMVLIRTVGGASGPLYGTFFLRASAVCSGKNELQAADVAALFEAGLNGILQRGKAQLQEKTMVDSLQPAVEAMQRVAQDTGDLQEMLQQGVNAAEKGMKATIPMLATKGRASYLGERSIGHQDPGATSTYFFIKSACDAWKES